MRLRAPIPHLLRRKNRQFQFLLVRLRVSNKEVTVTGILKFQFLLVRLRELELQKEEEIRIFQFLLVRLRALAILSI